jgi:serine/threonine protein kinase/tetratricopeptide (TPR) repeat protein
VTGGPTLSDARWQRVKQVFAGAIERGPGERPAFLEQACGGDVALRREVESLIAAHGQAASFLDSPAVGSGAPEVQWLGRRIGAYRVVGELGRGGMGAVFCAVRDDDAFSKEVALKLVRGGLDSELLVRRFHRERHILARLQHPSIAGVLDGGTTEEGQPYLVMEYVEGEPIDRYCASHGLSIRARLEMFRRVCGAVHYAHQNLVVHRDLKPANLLVTEDGTPKLLDFGIAKLLDPGDDAESAPTATLLPVMTPEYASPEQVRGEAVTTATDVYSLGVMLYELLTGLRPYSVRLDSLELLVRTVCETEPPSPSTVVAGVGRTTTRPPSTASELRGDLDTIVMKALRKEPSRRYGSAQELSEDIRRHLVGLPVLARPDTFGYRAAKFAGRHKAGVAGAAAAAVLIVGFSASTFVQSARIRRERDKATRVSAFMVDLFKVADPTTTSGDTVTAREILDLGVERIRTELKGEPEVRATLMDTMGVVYKNLALYEKAEPLLREALETQRRVLGEDPAVAETMSDLAILLWHKGEYEETEALLRECLAMRRKVLGADHPKVAKTLVNLGNVRADKGDAAGAEALYRDALAIQRRLPTQDPELPKMIENLAIVLQERGAYTEAEPLYREALAMARKVLGIVYQARTMGNLATLLEEMGEYAAAESLLRDALEIKRRALGNAHPSVAENMGTLAQVLARRGDYAAAESLCRDGLAVELKTLGERHPQRASTLEILGRILTAKGDPGGAEPLFREGLSIARERLGEEHVTVASLESGLADALRDEGKLVEAEAEYRKALAMDRKLIGDKHPSTARPLTGLGRLLVEKGDPAAAEPLLREALAIRRGALPGDHPDIAEAESALGTCLVAQGRFVEAEPLLIGSYPRIEAKRTARSREARDALGRIVKLYQAWGKPAELRRYAALVQDGASR